ncbi:MAG TPA: hypothetical protein VF335_05495 [Chitinivibrionales bacterium]
MNRLCTLSFLFSAFVLCSWTAVFSATELTGEMRLKFCISNFENGEYQKAADSLETLVPALSEPDQQMEAYKYLAYSYGMLNRIEKSKAVFQLVLKKYPRMTIDTLEAPPNIAIIFRQVKLEKKIETLNSARPKTIVVIQKKNVTAPVILLSCSFLAAAGSAGLFYYATQQHQKYHSVDPQNPNRQSLMDRYFSRYQYASIGGIVSGGVAAVMLPLSIYYFAKKEPVKKGVSVSFVNGLPSVVYSF